MEVCRAHLARRDAVGGAELLVELAQGREAGLEGDVLDRERALEEQKRRNAENVKTIDSLKAVIDDFSRSVEGYMRDREESDQTISSSGPR